jgi:hypothetical protein
MEYRERYFAPEALSQGVSGASDVPEGRITPENGMQDTRLERSGHANLVPPPTGTDKVVNEVDVDVEDAVTATTGHSTVGPHSQGHQKPSLPSAAWQWPVKVHIETGLTGKVPKLELPAPRSDSPPTPEKKVAGELTDLMQFQLSPRSQITRSRSKAD